MLARVIALSHMRKKNIKRDNVNFKPPLLSSHVQRQGGQEHLAPAMAQGGGWGGAASVGVGRIVFGLLGLITFVTVLYTLATDGSPFRRQLLTPWMAATLIDFYVNVAVITIWVCYKETSWISASIWTVLLICFGSITTSWYIAWKLFHLPAHAPLYVVLLKEHHARMRCEYVTLLEMFLTSPTLSSAIFICGR